jgi:hypothetical protein
MSYGNVLGLLRAAGRPLSLRFKAGLSGLPSVHVEQHQKSDLVSATFTAVGTLGLKFRPVVPPTGTADEAGVQLVGINLGTQADQHTQLVPGMVLRCIESGGHRRENLDAEDFKTVVGFLREAGRPATLHFRHGILPLASAVAKGSPPPIMESAPPASPQHLSALAPAVQTPPGQQAVEEAASGEDAAAALRIRKLEGEVASLRLAAGWPATPREGGVEGVAAEEQGGSITASLRQIEAESKVLVAVVLPQIRACLQAACVEQPAQPIPWAAAWLTAAVAAPVAGAAGWPAPLEGSATAFLRQGGLLMAMQAALEAWLKSAPAPAGAECVSVRRHGLVMPL